MYAEESTLWPCLQKHSQDAELAIVKLIWRLKTNQEFIHFVAFIKRFCYFNIWALVDLRVFVSIFFRHLFSKIFIKEITGVYALFYVTLSFILPLVGHQNSQAKQIRVLALTHLAKRCIPCYEIISYLSCSQQSRTGPNSEADESSPHSHTLCLRPIH